MARCAWRRAEPIEGTAHMLVNTRTVRIEWGDCDPAGIVYYPRYFAFFDASTSALIERALGMTKHDYLAAYDSPGIRWSMRIPASSFRPATATTSRSKPPWRSFAVRASTCATV